jgi:hypothetical protein
MERFDSETRQILQRLYQHIPDAMRRLALTFMLVRSPEIRQHPGGPESNAAIKMLREAEIIFTEQAAYSTQQTPDKITDLLLNVGMFGFTGWVEDYEQFIESNDPINPLKAYETLKSELHQRVAGAQGEIAAGVLEIEVPGPKRDEGRGG